MLDYFKYWLCTYVVCIYCHNINTFLESPIHDDNTAVPEIIQTPEKLKRQLFSDITVGDSQHENYSGN